MHPQPAFSCRKSTGCRRGKIIRQEPALSTIRKSLTREAQPPSAGSLRRRDEAVDLPVEGGPVDFALAVAAEDRDLLAGMREDALVLDDLLPVPAQRPHVPEDEVAVEVEAVELRMLLPAVHHAAGDGFRDVVRHLKGDGGVLIGNGRYESVRDERILMRAKAPFWEVSWGAAKIKVDRQTGEVKIQKFVTIADAGKAINPQQCHSQEVGAVMQGVGQTLFEEIVYDNGSMLNSNLVNYRVPGVNDLPEELVTILFENGNGPGPYGAKGIGESGLLTIPSAVGNALFNAVGVRLMELPLTSEKVWRAIKQK